MSSASSTIHRPRRRARGALWTALALACLAAPGALRAAAAGPKEPSEYEVKAAFLVHFFGYVKWPPDAFENARSPLVLAVIGEDPFGEVLDKTMRGRRIGKRPIRVLRVPDPAELPDAHLAFLPRSESERLPRVLQRYARTSALVVADEQGLATRGAGAGFFLDERKVRFEVNVDALARARLEASSQLLKLARIVRDERRGEDGR